MNFLIRHQTNFQLNFVGVAVSLAVKGFEAFELPLPENTSTKDSAMFGFSAMKANSFYHMGNI